MKHVSCGVAIAEVIDDILEGFDTRVEVPDQRNGRYETSLALLLDLSDAFSKIPHERIIGSLIRLKVPAYLIRFIAAWLSDRRGKVFYDGSTSQWVLLTAGGPQGSVASPMLFLLVIDALDRELNLQEPAITTRLVHCRHTFWADDLTLQTRSAHDQRNLDAMQQLCNTVTTWCARNNLRVSVKTRLMAFRRRSHGIPLLNDIQRDQSEAGILLQPGVRVGNLTVRLQVGSDNVQPHAKLLGVLLDENLNFSAHIDAAASAASVRLLKLASIAPYVPQRYLGSIWRSAATTMLFACEAWFSRATQRSAGGMLQPVASRNMPLSKLEVVHARGCRVARRLVASLRGEKAIALATMNRLQTWAEITLVKTCYRLSALEDAPGMQRRFAILRGRVNPNHRKVDGLHPIRFPIVPPSERCDRVIIHTEPTIKDVHRESPADLRRAANEARRQQLLLDLPYAHVFHGYFDGSVLTDYKLADGTAGTEPWGGAAAAIFIPQSHTPLITTTMVPSMPCSYTAESWGKIALVRNMTTTIKQWRMEHNVKASEIGVLILGDGKSIMDHTHNGPLHSAAICPLVWEGLDELATECDKVCVGHIFAHCDDKRGDIVDEAAKEAAAQYARAGSCIESAWHVDAARRIWSPIQRRADEQLLAANDMLRAATAATGKHFPARCRAPPIGLDLSIAKDISQIRSGVWFRLGYSAVVHDSPVVCRICRTSSMRAEAKAVRHMFECSGASHEHAVTIADVFAEDVATLTKVHDYCMQFAVVTPPTTAPTCTKSTGTPSQTTTTLRASLNSRGSTTSAKPKSISRSAPTTSKKGSQRKLTARVPATKKKPTSSRSAATRSSTAASAPRGALHKL
jgi:hypothetical protein